MIEQANALGGDQCHGTGIGQRGAALIIGEEGRQRDRRDPQAEHGKIGEYPIDAVFERQTHRATPAINLIGDHACERSHGSAKLAIADAMLAVVERRPVRIADRGRQYGVQQKTHRRLPRAV